MAEGTKIDILKDRDTTAVATDEASGSKTPLSRKKRILLISGVAALALLGIGGGAVVAVGPSSLLAMVSGPADPAAEQAATDAAADEEVAPEGGEKEGGADDVLLLDDMIINLVRIEDAVNRYARVRIAVVYDREALGIGTLEAKRSHLRDSFNDYLSQMTERDLQGTFGLVSLKEELLRRARVVAGQKAITDVLVTDLVFQ